MKIEIDGKHIRIMGNNFGNKRHIKLYVNDEKEGEDCYSFSIIEGGMERGCLQSVTISHSDIVVQNNLEAGRQIIR